LNGTASGDCQHGLVEPFEVLLLVQAGRSERSPGSGVSVADLFERVRSADERYPAVAVLDEVPSRVRRRGGRRRDTEHIDFSL
jgi:hypothetical protein